MERMGVAFSGGLPPTEIVECVKLAEELGYESAWVAEGHGGDQFAILGACAVATRHILLGTSISSVFVRSATTIGMAAATVDHLSRGRFILGLGSSHRVQVEPEHGLAFVQPTARLRDTIAIVRGLVRDGVVSHRGDDRAVRPLVPAASAGHPDLRGGALPADARDRRRAGPGGAPHVADAGHHHAGRRARRDRGAPRGA
jgi:alkanesulfonate monooxygenase SsuD/methylene tetrahydromethanopterin reductase-like flavin-dependent oxidoreductase (luciferase family)